MTPEGRIHRNIELIVDQFVVMCSNRIKELGIDRRVWVSKDFENSMVNVGDPDKISASRNFGFTISYESIMDNFADAYEGFEFKLNHFIKMANSMGKFNAFRTEEDNN